MIKRIFHFTLAGVLACTLAACGSSGGKTEMPEAGYRQVGSREAAELMAEEHGYIILDVRTLEEYEERHIPGAVCIPNETIGNEAPALLPDKEQLILVYCRSGNRSRQAAAKLAKLGYTNVVEFGGINSWTGKTVQGAEI